MFQKYFLLIIFIFISLKSISQQIIIEKDGHFKEITLPCTIGVNPLFNYNIYTYRDSLVVIGKNDIGVFKYIYTYKEQIGLVLIKKEKAAYIEEKKEKYVFSDGSSFISD
ncbi:MAG: hypothetical protein ACTHK8_14905 [Ginsengibacter sp.]